MLVGALPSSPLSIGRTRSQRGRSPRRHSAQMPRLRGRITLGSPELPLGPVRSVALSVGEKRSPALNEGHGSGDRAGTRKTKHCQALSFDPWIVGTSGVPLRAGEREAGVPAAGPSVFSATVGNGRAS